MVKHPTEDRELIEQGTPHIDYFGESPTVQIVCDLSSLNSDDEFEQTTSSFDANELRRLAGKLDDMPMKRNRKREG